MLEMLCDAAEAEDHKESKTKELKMMNKIMDERKRKRDEIEQTRKLRTIKKEVDNCEEEYSKVLLKEHTRKLSKIELDAKVTKRRQFVSIEKIDSKENLSSTGLVGNKAAGFFTVGVIVDKIGVLNSKGGKRFTIVKLSDLVKYDLNRVKNHLTKLHGSDQDGFKQAFRAFTSDGYKTISIMAFNDSALPAKNIPSGTLIAVMNPRILPPSSNAEKQQGPTFAIDTIDSVVQIGFSREFNICARTTTHPVSKKEIPCHKFVNTSVEKICE